MANISKTENKTTHENNNLTLYIVKVVSLTLCAIVLSFFYILSVGRNYLILNIFHFSPFNYFPQFFSC